MGIGSVENKGVIGNRMTLEKEPKWCTLTSEDNIPTNHSGYFLRERTEQVRQLPLSNLAWGGKKQETVPISPNKINVLAWENPEFSCYPAGYENICVRTWNSHICKRYQM